NLKVKKLFTPLYLTATAWIFQGLVLVVFANYLEVDISSTMLISIYCSGLIIGALSLMPSGIGATELGILFLLTQLGVSEKDAILLSIGSRAFTLLPALILGLLCSLILSIKKRTRQLHSFK
ncbi:lysylphosphatidylglycerol synthase domain-containing protein, partial [Vibrio navarrensis]